MNILSSFQGNWVDLFLIILFIYYLIEGWGRGFLFGIFDLGSFIASFVIALKTYSSVGAVLATQFSLTRGMANAGGFLLSGLLVQTVFSIILNFIYRIFYRKFQRSHAGWLSVFFKIDTAFGFIPALGEAIIFAAFILTLFITLPIAGTVKKAILFSKIGAPLVSSTQGFERQLNSIFGEAVNETLTFLTINPNPILGEKVDLGFTQARGTVDEIAEERMLALVNTERKKAGLKPLIRSNELRDLARDFAKDLFSQGYFSHYNPEGESPFDRMNKRGISFLAAGENLALAPNVTLAHQGLMNSSGHRANILSPDFGKVGIGVIDGGVYGEMFVQEFTD